MDFNNSQNKFLSEFASKSVNRQPSTFLALTINAYSSFNSYF
jgi:hypothetical protein